MAPTVKQLVAPNGRKIKINTGLFVNNEFVPGSAPQIETVNPADESVICAVEAASAEDVGGAVKAARDAFKSWRQSGPTSRAAMIYKLADLVEANKEDIATLESWDNGKPYQVALAEDIEEFLGVIRYYAGWADKVHGQTMSNVGPDGYKFGYTIREPVGVCGQIIPWNYPMGEHFRSRFEDQKTDIP